MKPSEVRSKLFLLAAATGKRLEDAVRHASKRSPLGSPAKLEHIVEYLSDE